MAQLACHNPEIDQKTGEVKMTRCPEECGKQQRSKQGKLGWQKQKEEKQKGEEEKKQKEKEKKKEIEKKRKKLNKEKMVKIVEEQEIWDEEEEVAKSEEEAKKLVPEHFHKWIHIFGKKQSERMPTRKL